MKPFQAVILGTFTMLALFGVFIFATFSARQGDTVGTVEVWGSASQDQIDQLLTQVRGTRDDFNAVTYKEVSPDQLVPDLIAGIASGKGPDLVLFPSNAIVKDGDKLSPIPYATLTKRAFLDSFIDASDAFLVEDGILGLPFSVDPLVLYWNRTLFANAAVSRPPKYWDELATVAPKITKKNPNGSLTVSAVALGEWVNVLHAKAIIATLSEQLGVPVVVRDERTNSYRSELSSANEQGILAADSVLRFYADFSNPVKPTYSWNRSLKTSRDAFIAGQLALYIAPASELTGIREANPNLDFDVAPMPVARGAGEATAADMVAFAVPRGSKNPTGAIAAALEMTSAPNASFMAQTTRMPSARRDVEVGSASDAYLAVFRSAALKSFVFLDPDPRVSDSIFARMIDNISSGRMGVSEAIRAADDELQEALRMR